MQVIATLTIYDVIRELDNALGSEGNSCRWCGVMGIEKMDDDGRYYYEMLHLSSCPLTVLSPEVGK